MEARLRGSELKLDGIMWGVRLSGEEAQTCPTIDGWKRVVIGSNIFPPDFSECSEQSGESCLVSRSVAFFVLTPPPMFRLAVWREVRS